MPRSKVLVVDDHPLLRRGVMDVLALQEGLLVVGEASNGQEAIQRAKELQPDVIVMDLQMPVMDGLEATQAIAQEVPTSKIVIFTVSEKEGDLFQAIRVGARGYVLKNATAADLVRAVFHIAQGGVIISPDMASKLLKELAVKPEPIPEQEADSVLSPREAEVLRFVAAGKTNKEIASALFLSENTVKTHMRNIMDKLHVVNRIQAATHGVRPAGEPPRP
ncbi:MAG: response regulator transcription factor [Chloroflexi bacterium]|nr:response regulator transcription factor [Chloroflexota bacterium]